MTEWKPVVGGRAWWNDESVLVCEFGPDGSVMIASADADIEDNREFWVQLADLTEHPDDRRHRRLLEAARAAGKTWAAMRGAKAPKLQALVKMEHAAAIKALRAIVAECDQAEASHA